MAGRVSGRYSSRAAPTLMKSPLPSSLWASRGSHIMSVAAAALPVARAITPAMMQQQQEGQADLCILPQEGAVSLKKTPMLVREPISLPPVSQYPAAELRGCVVLIVKPDAKGKELRILSEFEKRGYELVAIDRRRPPRDIVEKHYLEHKGKPFYNGLVDRLADKPVTVAIMKLAPITIDGVEAQVPAEKAVQRARTITGATDPAAAAPSSIRGLFGFNVEQNALHCSDSVQSAITEATVWFPPQDLPTSPASPPAPAA